MTTFHLNPQTTTLFGGEGGFYFALGEAAGDPLSLIVKQMCFAHIISWNSFSVLKVKINCIILQHFKNLLDY